jgi:UDP-glucose 4-epimerase
MKALVTGGSGLVGTYVIRELLDSGFKTIVYDVKPPTDVKDVVFVKGTVTDADLMLAVCKEHQVDTIIHLAALLQFGCEWNPREAIEINVLGTLNLLEAARISDVTRFVYASSLAVYGPSADFLTEDAPIMPGATLYGATKRLCETLGFRYHLVHGVPFVALRFSAVYGPSEVSSPGMADVIGRIKNCIFGGDVIIPEVAANDHQHFVYVKDVAHATALATQAPLEGPRVFNIAGGDDNYVTFQEFYQTIKRCCPSAGNVLFQGRGQNLGKLDVNAAKRELGYQPRYTLEMGIRENLEHWRKAGEPFSETKSSRENNS